MTKTEDILRRRLLTAVGRAWAKGAPLSMRPRDGERFIARVLSRGNTSAAIAIENRLFASLKAREIEEVVIARKPLTFGLRLAEVDAEVLRKFGGTSASKSKAIDFVRKNRLRKLVRKSCGSAEVAPQPIENIAERKCGSSLSYSLSKKKRRRAGLAPRATVFRGGRELPPNTPFEVGDVRLDNGQQFVCFEIVPCIRQDGAPSAYSLWRSACAECDAPFVHHGGKATFAIQRRRCPAHRSPGRRTRFAPARRKPRRKREEAVQ